MTPAPTQQSGETPWDRNQPYSAGGDCVLRMQGEFGGVPAFDVEQYTLSRIYAPTGIVGGALSPALDGSSYDTITFQLTGLKLALKLSVTIQDNSGGYPGPETTSDYDMGVSNATQPIALTATDSMTAYEIRWRF
jgi:hypothetical protein